MKNPNIARMLRYYRKINELTVADVSDHLGQKNMYAAPKTIYAWENGTTQPSADTLMELCSYYQIEDVLKTFGYEKDEDATPLYILSNDEKSLIDAYRNNKAMQSAVKKLLGLE